MKSLIRYLSLTSTFASSAFASSHLRSAQALLYPIDANDGATGSRTESPGLTEIHANEAQMIIDRRLDINLGREIGSDVSDNVLKTVGKFGGRQRPMFDIYRPEQPLRLGVILGGFEFEDLEKDYQKIGSPAPALGIEDFDSDTIWNAVDVKEEDGCTSSQETSSGLRIDEEITGCNLFGRCMKPGQVDKVDWTDEVLIERFLDWRFHKMCRNGHAIVRLSFPERSNDRIVKVFNKFHTALSANAKDGERESTILVLPSRSPSSLDRRQMPQEEPLTAANTKSSSASKQSTSVTATFSSPSNFTTLPSDLAIPRCFSTLSACNAGTNNCSLHGSCIQAHAPTTGDDANDSGCWSCSCKSTPNGRGGVISWGGHACQKKDISVQFWLFAGFGVTMFALVAGGIGMLYSMGSEPLPGVLGAGVGGPRASR